MVVNGDVLTDLDVTELVAFHRDRGAEATVALTPVADPSAFGVVPTDDEGRVVAFIEKPPPGQAPTNLINAGTYVLEPSVLARIPGDRRVSIERETFPAIVRDGRLYALGSTADWVDAGTPATYPGRQSAVRRGRLGGVRRGRDRLGHQQRAGRRGDASAPVPSWTASVCFDGATIGAGRGGALLDHRAGRPDRIGRGRDRPLGRR